MTPEKIRELLKKMRAAFDSSGKHPSWSEEKEDAVWEKIKAQTKGQNHPIRWLRWAAAAAVLALATSLYLLHPRKNLSAPVVANPVLPTPPGSNKAYLLLAGGQRIVLDDAQKGALTTQGGTKIVKQDSGLLAYHPTTGTGELLYNTVVTPRGGQYQLILPDGTRVWLNAGTSLRFPTAFNGSERIVQLTGEAYFEVKHIPGRPFRVQTGRHEVEDIGTAFNINAYNDEPVAKVTLIEGEARVTGKRALTLHPGQQARWQAEETEPGRARATAEETETLASDIDTEDVLAWKNGQISFMNPDFSCIMRQISRWYDVDIRYSGAVPKGRFFGILSRNVNLPTILEFFEHNHIHVRQEGRTLVVAPQ